MFGKTKNPQQNSKKPPVVKTAPRSVAILSVIAHDTNILGSLVSEGSVDFDGKIDGNIRCHTLTVRKNGYVKGDIDADIVHVYGKTEGIIRAKNVNLYADCHVEGIILHDNISIENGAFIDGKCKRSDKTSDFSDELEGKPYEPESPTTIRLIS